MIRALIPVIVVLTAFLVACGDDGSKPSTAASDLTPSASPSANVCPPARPPGNGDHVLTIASGGVERTYAVHVPASYTGDEAVALVLGFHGYSMTADGFANLTEFASVSDGGGFIFAALDGTGSPQRWNTGDGPGADMAFAAGVIDALSEQYCIDEARVYATGYSNGGGMAQALACAMPDRIAGIGVVASTFIACRANVPMIAFHGTEDAIVPFEGGATPAELQAIPFPNVRRAATEWAREMGCDALAVISRPSSEVELSTFRRCRGGGDDVLLYTILGGGHTWPGAPVSIEVLGLTTQQIEASQAIWKFFAAHPRTR